MSRGKLFFFPVLFALMIGKEGSSQTIKERVVPIKTYPFSDANPVAPMAVNDNISRFYPYYMFEGYTNKDTMMNWKVIELENNYISVKILPGVGGKVWGATDKLTGNEFVYQNDVMKFRAIGSRGPWTSGGIEHNFGLDIGHAPWAASPVDYIIEKEKDGSVSCTVGGLDLASRTQWRVTIRLPRNASYFETSALMYNPTPLHHAYLSWENAAFKASNDLQFYFPGDHYINHDGSVRPWPMLEDGRNISLYRNNDFESSKSYHVFGSTRNWFGGIWQDKKTGFGHWAPYQDAPGKKLWIWSLARDGAIWEDLLTDDHGQYIEAQSGVKFNQADLISGLHSPFKQLSFHPGYTETKNETWFPVNGIKGISDASKQGSLYVHKEKDSLHIWISPNMNITDSLFVSIGNKAYRTLVALTPLTTFHTSYAYPAGEKIEVNFSNNTLHYKWPGEKKELSRPLVSANDVYPDHAEYIFQAAEDRNSMRLFKEALNTYLECLKKDPTHLNALVRVAEIYYRTMEYDKALTYTTKALEINTYYPGANYLYGIIQVKKGNLNKATEAFSVAVRSLEFRSEAYTRLAAINVFQKDYEAAVYHTEKALEYNMNNLTALELHGTALRKLKRIAEAVSSFGRLLKTDPLNHYARFEKYMISGSSNDLSSFRKPVTNEFPHETFLELACAYFRYGLTAEAIKVLQLSPQHPTVFYWLAYLLKDSSPKESKKYLSKADEHSAKFVFPFRDETVPVLEWAIQQSSSWKPKYYLALIFWNRFQTEKAKDLFNQCSDPAFAPFHLAKSVLTNKESDIRRAIDTEPSEWRSWHFLSEYLFRAGRFNEALEHSKKVLQILPDNLFVRIDYAKSLLYNNQFEKCIRVLRTIHILPQEGAQEGHDIYASANMLAAIEKIKFNKYDSALYFINESRKWPENLGAGQPYDPDNRLQDYLAIYCMNKKGNTATGTAIRDSIISYTLRQWPNASAITNNYVALSIIKQSGKIDQAEQLLEKWKTTLDSLHKWGLPAGKQTPELKWVLSKLSDENVKDILEPEIADLKTRLFWEAYKLYNE